MDAIALHAMTKDYSGERALKGVDLVVAPGTLFGLIGADGAGKSTLLQIVNTLLRPDSGHGEVLGLDLRTGMRAIRRQVGMMTQKFSLYPDLTVLENLEFFAAIFALDKQERRTAIASLLDFTRLGSAADRRAGRLSGGMKQKLALACALIHKPRLLVLDEPSVGVDPVTRRDFWAMLKDLQSRDGLTTLVSTPYMDEAERCDGLVFLHKGQVLAQGSPMDLCARMPGRIFRVQGKSVLHWPVDKPAPFPLLRLYAQAGELRAVLPDQENGIDAVNGAMASLGWGEQIVKVEETSPNIEDVLLSKLLEVA